MAPAPEEGGKVEQDVKRAEISTEISRGGLSPAAGDQPRQRR